jgi:DUF917 family protein
MLRTLLIVTRESLLTMHRTADAVRALMNITGLDTFDAVIPNEIGGLNAFEAILAAHRLGKSALDTDLVARAYPMMYQTVRCLNGVSITPSALTDGTGKAEVSLPKYQSLLTC